MNSTNRLPHDVQSNRLQLQVMTGIHREMLLEFYAASGDFTRRLTSIKANSKFSSPAAGPDDLYSVRLVCKLFDLQLVTHSNQAHGISRKNSVWCQVSQGAAPACCPVQCRARRRTSSR